MAHYIAMSGSVGCLPDYCTTCDSEQDAVDSLSRVFDDCMGLDRLTQFRFELMNGGFASLSDVTDAGAQYAEIVECDCKTPEIHTEGK